MLLLALMLFPWISDPDLIYDKVEQGVEGFEEGLELFPAGYNPKKTVRVEVSGKFNCNITTYKLIIL